MIELACPNMLWLFILPVFIYFILPAVRRMYGDSLKVPFVEDITEIKSNSKHIKLADYTSPKVSLLKMLLLIVVWCLLVVALCRPQWVGEPRRVKNEGRDILLVVDISKSMLERDFAYQGKYYDRLTTVKSVVQEFIDKRTEDRIGLVLFGTRAYMQVPLTYDKQSIKDVLSVTEAGMAGNSTSIGDAVGVALKNLPHDDINNKIIILLTDGENNDGSLSMLQAMDLAQQENVKVYTIGVGSDETALFGGFITMQRDSGLDEESLKKLAAVTDGFYFRAKDVSSLQKIYRRIDELEPQTSEGRIVQETKDLFYLPAFASLLLFLLVVALMRKV